MYLGRIVSCYESVLCISEAFHLPFSRYSRLFKYRLAGVSRLFLILEISPLACFQHKSSTTGVISSVDLSVQAANALHYPTRGLYRLLDLGGKKDFRAGG